MTSSNTVPYMIKYSDNGRNVYYASTLSYVAQCGDIFGYTNVEDMSRMVPEGYSNDIPSAPTIIPMYGYVAQSYIPKDEIGFYTKDTVNRSWSEAYILSTMYHQGIPIIWYDEQQITEEELEQLEKIAADFPNQILVLPWLKYDNLDIPANRKFAFARMGGSQSCNEFNFNIFIDFLAFLKREEITRAYNDLKIGQVEDELLVDVEKYSDK